MEIDPHDKAMIDNVVDVQERSKSRRDWVIALVTLGVSLLFLHMVNSDSVSGWLADAFAVLGVLGILVFLAFLSTKPFGRSDYSWRWWV